MEKIKNHELISDDEWFRRLITDKEYLLVQFDWAKGVTRVLRKEDGKMFDVSCVNVGKRRMLKVNELI